MSSAILHFPDAQTITKQLANAVVLKMPCDQKKEISQAVLGAVIELAAETFAHAKGAETGVKREIPQIMLRLRDMGTSLIIDNPQEGFTIKSFINIRKILTDQELVQLSMNLETALLNCAKKV